jgi:hypothetical protein
MSDSTPAMAEVVPARATSVAARSASDALEAEERTIQAVRHGVHGLGALSVRMLAAMQPLVAQAETQLRVSAGTGDCDPAYVVGLIKDLSTALARASGSVQALVASQSAISGREAARPQLHAHLHAHKIEPRPTAATDDDMTAKLLAHLARAREAERVDASDAYEGEESGSPDPTPEMTAVGQ